jgi:hypothetical protein
MSYYYMTLPPGVEMRKAFRRTENLSPSTLGAWHQVGAADPITSWKNEVFAKLAKLERGSGDFRLSENAADQLRVQLANISLQSLPFPSVIALSGQGAQLDWRTGERSVEVTAFADGELVIEAAEAGNTIDLDSMEDLESYLEWLVGAADRQLVYAAAR